MAIIVKVVFGRVHVLSNNINKLAIVIHELLKQDEGLIREDVKK